MIEAVSTSVVNSAQARLADAARPEDGGRTQAALDVPESNIREAVFIPFVSPVVNVDININQVVLQFRDSETGEVQDQIPTQRELAAFDRSKELAISPASVENTSQPELSANSTTVTVADTVEPEGGQATGNAGDTVVSRVSVSV